MSDSVITIGGFMGTGKTTVAPLIARSLGFKLVDIDLEVVTIFGCSIVDIFKKKGELQFRTVEEKLIRQCLDINNIVIALGGGSLHWNDNYQWIRERSRLFVLTAEWSVISKRIAHNNSRPLALNAKALYEARNEIYLTAGVNIAVGERNPIELCQLILENIHE
jgi:shikimate kinase